MSIRWHTDPQYENTPTQKQRELYDLVNLDSYEPLYLEIQKSISRLQKTNSSSEDLFWLKSVKSAFDSYVTRVLNDIRMEPWDYEHRIRDEYTKIYTEPLPLKTSIRTVMGRLMTYKEIWSYAREAESRDTTSNRNCNSSDWFWRRPEPKPIWKREPRFISGIHPTQRNRVYHVTYEKPWNSSSRFAELDPSHNWGVFIDQTRSYTDDSYVRVLMACCAEPVGKTEGCWIALEEDKNAVEGIVKPYRVYHTAFDNIWLNISNNSPPPKDDFIQNISKDFQIGTAFQDLEKYKALHTSIKEALKKAAPVIQDAFGIYQKNLQDVLDANEEAGNSMRDTNPFESILSKEQRDTVVLPLRLRDEFNAIQMLSKPLDGPLNPKDFVNQSVFRVGDMLKEFTFDKMGGFLLSTTGERITLLKTNTFENVSNLQKIISKIDKTQGKETKDDELKELKGDIEEILERIQMLESQRIRRAELQKLDSLFKSFGDVTGLVPAALDWSRMQARLTRYENIESQIINKQVEVNESIKSLRTDAFVPTKFTISDIFALPTISADETLFKENMDVAILKKSTEALSIEEVPEVGVPPLSIIDLNNQYLLIINAYTKTTNNLKDIDLPNPIQEKIRDRPGFKNAKTLVTDTITKQNRFLTTIQKNLKRFAARLRFIDNQTGVSENVKNRVAVDLGFSAKVTASENLREKTQQTKQAALIEYTSNVQKETKDYNTEQDTYTKNASAVIKALETQTKKPITTTDEIEPLFANMLQSIESLKTVDALEQQYLDYKLRLEAVFKTLPSKASVDAAPKKGDYLKNWNTNVLVAASTLASALDSILQSLLQKKLTDLPQQNKRVSEALETFEAKVSAANALIESETERKKREAEQEAERLEKERKRKEDQEKTDNQILSNNRQSLSQLDAWLKNTKDEFLKNSSSGLSTVNGLRDTKIRFTTEEKILFVFKSNGILPSEFNVGVLRIENPYTKLYLGDEFLDIVEQTWKAFGEYVLYRGTSKQDEKLNALNLLQNEYEKVLPKQPIKTENIENTIKLKTFKPEFEKLRPPQGSLFHKNTFIWAANSCWLDSVFLALFGYSGNKITEHVLTKGIGNYTSVLITYTDGTSQIIESKCSKNELEELHENIVQDIIQISSPLITNDTVCKLRTRNAWTKCVRDALPIDSVTGVATGEFGTATAVLETLKQIYKIEELEMKDSEIDVSGSLSSQVVIDAKPLTRFYAFNTNYYDNGNDTRTQLQVDLDNNLFSLSAIVCGSGTHFVTYLKDFYAKEWLYIDVTGGGWKIISSPVLDNDVHNLSKNTYKPLIYFYLRKDDINDLLAKVSKPPTPAPPSTPNILPFSINPSEAFPFGDSQQIEKLFNETIQKTNWLSNEQKAATLLQDGNDWNNIQGTIQKLDRVRLEGLLYAWFIVRNTTVRTLNAEQRLLVGITRADLDELDLIPNPLPTPTPTPTPIVITPPPPTPIVVVTPPPAPIVLKDLVGNKLFAEPVDKTSFEAAYGKALQTIGNRMDLGLGPKMDPILDVLKDPYRLTGLMHAWWGQQNNDEEAKVRGMSMADLNLE